MTFALHGLCASKGVAIGKVHIVEHGQLEVVEYALPLNMREEEVTRFTDALDVAHGELRGIKAQIPYDTATDVAAFIDTHLLMLEDSAITRVPIELIREKGCNAEWALKLQRDAIVSVFEAMDDPYLRTRKNDVDHVVNRIQRTLLNQDMPLHDREERPLSGRIVFADDLTPADTVLMQHQGIAAFVTEHGGPNSHTAIIARSLRIPAIVGLHHARNYLRDDELIIIDGRQGVVLVDPEEGILRQYRKRRRSIQQQAAARKKLRRQPVVTGDGERIVLQANVELPADIDAVGEVGADGIGLYRTEFLFMNREQPPEEEEQYAAYARVVQALNGSPVTIRTLDLGADKQVDGVRADASVASNPALGLRAVRLCLREPGLFRPQLRAILRASGHGPVRMMIPMVSTVQELLQVLRIVEECRTELQYERMAYDRSMPIGAMIEVPAAAICADMFARHLDFLSIGTNDLIQYTMAIDRIDDEVNYLYDPLNPAVLRLVHTTIKAGQKVGIPVAMCGEMAGDARYTRLLLGMGLKEFSVHPHDLLEVKEVITGSRISELRKLTQRVLRATKASTRAGLVDEMNHMVSDSSLG